MMSTSFEQAPETRPAQSALQGNTLLPEGGAAEAQRQAQTTPTEDRQTVQQPPEPNPGTFEGTQTRIALGVMAAQSAGTVQPVSVEPSRTGLVIKELSRREGQPVGTILNTAHEQATSTRDQSGGTAKLHSHSNEKADGRAGSFSDPVEPISMDKASTQFEESEPPTRQPDYASAQAAAVKAFVESLLENFTSSASDATLDETANRVREVDNTAEPSLAIDVEEGVAQPDLSRQGPPLNGHCPAEPVAMEINTPGAATANPRLSEVSSTITAGEAECKAKRMRQDMLAAEAGGLPFSHANGGLLTTSSPGTHNTARPDPEGHSIASMPNGSIANGHLALGDELDLRFSPASKKRRTTIGRPQTSKAPGEFVANLIADSRVWEDDPRSLEQLVVALENHFSPEGAHPADRILLPQILKAGVLKGQPVHYRALDGVGQEITGHVMHNGRIACDCIECEGEGVSVCEFEEHSGAVERHAGECVRLTKHNTSLKELCSAVNIACGQKVGSEDALKQPPQRARRCQVCHVSSTGLLRCGGGCKMRAHPACLGYENGYTGPWTCLNCMEERQRMELEKAEESRARAARRAQKALDAAQLKAAEARRASIRLQETPRTGHSKKMQASRPSSAPRSGSKPQRVHMAAPTAKVGLSQGRMVRNSNKHKRLFDPDEPNGVKNGEKVVYQTSQGEKLLDGEVHVSRDGPCGILCGCCNNVISCSQFEAHAGRGSRRAPYDNIFTMAGISLRRLAAALPSEVPVYHHEAEEEQDAVQEDMLGGCVLCKEKNFQREGFSDLTVILCDQCEREFHVGCLRKHKDIDLQGLPEGDWFCCSKCQEIHGALRKKVLEGSFTIDADYQWQLLHGKDGSHATTWALKACYETLQESFDPIIDQVSGQDLVKGMVYSMQQGEWDHTGMFTAVLRHKKQPVCALVMRAFGDMLAEVPLIATRLTARRKGHARFLMAALSELLAQIGVRTLSLPAAHATVETWTRGFDFQPMAADQLLETRESLRLLVFPGTEVLYKVLLPDAEPYPATRRDKSPPAEMAEAKAAEAAQAASLDPGDKAEVAGEAQTANTSNLEEASPAAAVNELGDDDSPDDALKHQIVPMQTAEQQESQSFPIKKSSTVNDTARPVPLEEAAASSAEEGLAGTGDRLTVIGAEATTHAGVPNPPGSEMVLIPSGLANNEAAPEEVQADNLCIDGSTISALREEEGRPAVENLQTEVSEMRV